MSDGTKSRYTKTGKKVKSIDDGRVDLTYNWVYDVFIDNKGDEFIIDDIGDKRYWSIYDDDYYELVDDTVTITGNVTTTDETKPKFKVGDKVKVVNIDYISEFAGIIKVGHIGDIIHIDENDCLNPYQVRFDGFDVRNSWWFTDKCIELVNDDTDTIENNPTESAPIVSDGSQIVSDGSQIVSDGSQIVSDGSQIVSDGSQIVSDGSQIVSDGSQIVSDGSQIVSDGSQIVSDGSQIVSDGGSSSYYTQQIPKGMLERFNTTGTIEAKDVIRLFLGNDFNMGNIFKAYCRIISLRNGKGKAGIDEQYDLTKVKYFAEDELNYYLENKDV